MKKQNKCLRCGKEWKPWAPNPKYCPRCKSPYWNIPKTKDTERYNIGRAEITQIAKLANISEQDIINIIKK